LTEIIVLNVLFYDKTYGLHVEALKDCFPYIRAYLNKYLSAIFGIFK